MIPDDVSLDIEMLGLFVGGLTLGNIDGWLVVAPDRNQMGERHPDLLEEVLDPGSVERSVIQGNVFGFHGRVGHGIL